MKERPILFSAPMVRAILDGLKSQTRHKDDAPGDSASTRVSCPHGAVGDRLWVRETHEAYYIGREEFPGKPDKYTTRVRYRADDECIEVEIDAITYRKLDSKDSLGWTPSIFMPRWASRITLEITGVRVERLQDISEADAIAEGVRCGIDCPDHRIAFGRLWESINGAGSWALNPWVWCLEFKRVPA